MTTQVGAVEVEVRANLVPLQAGFAQAEAAAKSFGTKAEQAMRSGFGAGGVAASRSVQAVNADLVNLRFQINDVATGLLSGGSPFMVLSQQAGQFSQILSGAGGARGAVGLLGQAFLGMLNPINLAIAGIGVATYAATSFFSDTEEGADSANAALKRHETAIRDLKSAWGEAAEGVLDYLNKSPILVEGALADSQEDMASRTRGSFADQLSLINTVTQAVREQIAAGGDLADKTVENYAAWKQLLDPVDEVVAQLRSGAVPNAEKFQEAMQAIRSNPDLPDEIRDIAKLLQGATAEAYKFWQAWAAGSVASQAAIQGRFDNLPDDQAFSPQSMHRKPPNGGAPGYRGALQADVDRGSGGRGGGSKRDPFAAAMDKAADRLRQFEQERHALSLAGEALARYRAEMQFVNSVEDEWSKFTEKQRTALEAKTKEIGDGAVALEQFKEKQKEVVEAQRAMDQAMENLGQSFENIFMGIVEGGDSAKRAIMELVAELLRGALLGQGGLAGFFQKGGLIGGASVPSSVGGGGAARAVNAASRAAGRAGGVSIGGSTIVIQGNADSNTAAEMESRLRKVQREMAADADRRQRESWRTH